MRRLLVLLLACLLLVATAGTALGHAYLVSSSPSADARVAAAPDRVTLTFNEPVEVLQPGDVDLVDEEGVSVTAGAPRSGDDARVVRVPLRPGLPEGTYTVRYQIVGADSHVLPGVLVFGVGSGELAEPYFEGDGSAGPSATGAWSVSARFLELVGLGGLIGLLAFRWLVWRPALGRGAPEGEERTVILSWGRDAFWVGFGVLAVGAMLAEAYLLLVQSASVLGTSVLGALGDAAGVGRVLGDTRFGSLVQLRGALLFGVFALGALQFTREFGRAGEPRPPSAAGSRIGAAAIAVLLLAVLGGVAGQGHARVAELPVLQVGAQLVHIVAVAVWITGLALVALVHLRLPKIAAAEGPRVAARTLARFSRLALVAVSVAVATGVVRSLGELSDPAELWTTDYGQSILLKLALLTPIVLIALYNRRIVEALRRVSSPSVPTMTLVQRTAGAELVLSLAIVVVAALLAAQVPGGS